MKTNKLKITMGLFTICLSGLTWAGSIKLEPGESITLYENKITCNDDGQTSNRYECGPCKKSDYSRRASYSVYYPDGRNGYESFDSIQNCTEGRVTDTRCN